jgi:hypothetical protein
MCSTPLTVITIQVTPSSSASPLLAGLTGFSLTCEVSGIENLNSPTITYKWHKQNRGAPVHRGNTLSLSPLAASHAGHYTCVATINSDLLQPRNREVRNTQPVTVTIQCKCYSTSNNNIWQSER